MRRAGRRLSGGSARIGRRCLETNSNLLTETLRERIENVSETAGRRSEPWIVRSGILDFGTAVTGQALHSDESLISEVVVRLFTHSVLSRAQIETHATNSQVKLIGSRAAINFLSGKQVINIAKIVHNPICLTPFIYSLIA